MLSPVQLALAHNQALRRTAAAAAAAAAVTADDADPAALAAAPPELPLGRGVGLIDWVDLGPGRR